MSKSFTLTECNLANSCQYEDCEIIYPLTVSDQVMIDNNTNLTQWINSISIPDNVTINTFYPTGVKVATINNIDIDIPYITDTTTNGLPKFDWDYFNIGTVNNEKKIQYALEYSIRNFGGDSVWVGNLLNNNDVMSNIYIPKPVLNYSYDSVHNNIDISLLLGAIEQNTVSIPISVITALGTNTTYTLSRVNNNIVLTDNEGNTSTAQIETYTAGNSIDISNNVISATYSVFTGATSTTSGTGGLVPAPYNGSQKYCLKGGGYFSMPDLWYGEFNVNTSQYSTLSDNDSVPSRLFAGENIIIRKVQNLNNDDIGFEINALSKIDNVSIIGNAGISVDNTTQTGTAIISHTNSITTGNNAASYNPATQILSVPTLNYDAQGHITSKTANNIEIPQYTLITQDQLNALELQGEEDYTVGDRLFLIKITKLIRS